MIILFSRRVWHMPSSQRCIIMSRSIIIPIQTFLWIQLLTIILVRLNIVRTCKYIPERIVMVRFLYASTLIDYHTIVTLMIFQVIMILVIIQRDITLFCQQQCVTLYRRLRKYTLCYYHHWTICYWTNLIHYIEFQLFPCWNLLLNFHSYYKHIRWLHSRRSYHNLSHSHWNCSCL